MSQLFSIRFKGGAHLINRDHFVHALINYPEDKVEIWLTDGSHYSLNGNAKEAEKEIKNGFEDEPSLTLDDISSEKEAEADD